VAEKGVRKEDYVRPHLRRLERRNQFGVYFILQSMELGPSFRSAVPKFPVDDPHYRILARQRSRYTHYYFYIRDEVLGPIALCVGSFLPFSITYYLNGHHFIERQLQRAGVQFRKDDNAFLWVADAQALQAAADRLSPQLIRQQLDHWTWVVGPKFSQKDRAAINLIRHYSLQQIEYCRNFIFRRNSPIHKLFERSCDLGLFRLTADKLSQVFGFRLHRRIRGKLASVLERTDHGHHVLRACGKNAVLRMYEKFSTFLRLEVLSNNLKDFGMKKSLDNLEAVRQILATTTDRFAQFEAHKPWMPTSTSPSSSVWLFPSRGETPKSPASKSRTPACSALWKSCFTVVPSSADGARDKSIRPSFLPSNSSPKAIRSPSSVTTSESSKPTPYFSETASVMPTA
jgi:hypothetical protein